MKYLRILIYSAGVIGMLAGCKDPDYGDPILSTNVDYAQIVYINAASDAGSIPFLVNNAPAVTLAFPASSSATSTIASSEQFRISKAKFGVVGADTVKATTDITAYTKLIAGASYTYILTDTLARPFIKGKSFSTDQGGLRLIQIVDSKKTIPAGNAAIRFFNLAPGAPAVYLTDNGNTITGFTTSQAYRVTSATFTNIQTGSHTLEVRSGSAAGPILAQLNVTFDDGKYYTVYLSGKTVASKNKVPYAVNVASNN